MSINKHELAEERSLALHQAIADRLPENPAILERARSRVKRWLESGNVHAHWAEQWHRVLSGSVDEIRDVLASRGEQARALRQVTPFAGAIPPRERWQIWKDVRHQLERNA